MRHERKNLKKIWSNYTGKAQFDIIHFYRLLNLYYIGDLSELNIEKALSHDV